MIEKIFMRYFDFIDRSKYNKFKIIGLILVVLVFCIIVYNIFRNVKKKKSDKPKKKVVGILESDSKSDVIPGEGILDLNTIDKSERLEIFSTYEKLIMPKGEDALDLHYINIPGVSIKPLANIRGTVSRARLRNESNSKSVTVMVDAFGIYDESRKGKPYYYVIDDQNKEPNHLDFDKDKLYDFVRDKLEIGDVPEILELPELETVIIPKKIDRTSFDAFLVSQNKKRKQGAVNNLNLIDGISDITSERLRRIGILFVEDIAELPDDLIDLVFRLLDNKYITKSKIEKWRNNAGRIKTR